MTLRSALATYLARLLEENHPAEVPPPPSPTSTPPIPTPSTPIATTPADPMITVMEMMVTMQRESQRETRELVLSILQGRPSNGTEPTTDPTTMEQILGQPNYDDDSIPLPGGIQAVFEREATEQEGLRQLRTEQEVLAAQWTEARRQLVEDPQGPGDFGSY